MAAHLGSAECLFCCHGPLMLLMASLACRGRVAIVAYCVEYLAKTTWAGCVGTITIALSFSTLLVCLSGS